MRRRRGGAVIAERGGQARPGDREGDGDAPAAGSPPARVAARTAAPAAARPAPATVVLLEAGRKPRRMLRYKLPASYRDKLGMKIRVAMEVGSGAETAKIELPVIRLAMDLAASGEREGDRVFRFELTDADALPGDKMFAGMHDHLVAQMKKAVGATGTMVVDPRGVNRAVSLELPPDMDPQMSESMRWSHQAMEQMSAPCRRSRSASAPAGRSISWSSSTG